MSRLPERCEAILSPAYCKHSGVASPAPARNNTSSIPAFSWIHRMKRTESANLDKEQAAMFDRAALSVPRSRSADSNP
ncbi:MAG: hypothetical protein KME45_24445 [Stenomitos rutilans HA7619-LM2]|nr:hypothetical protein [Stenomitos rutilans HA7619-LM2]